MDVFEARRGEIDGSGKPVEEVPIPAFFGEGGADALLLAVAPTPALERAVEVRAGGAVEEDAAHAQKVARESTLDERTFAEPLYSTMSEGAVAYAQKLLSAATRCSVEHGEVLRCCLPVDPLERARFRVMELAILRVALSELELRAPASVVIFEAEMATKDYCDTGMHVPVRRVLTTYLSETTRGGENGWGAAKPEAPWDYHPEMLLNPKKTQAKAVSAGPKKGHLDGNANVHLTPRALAKEGGVAPAPTSSGTSKVVTGTDAASADIDALLDQQTSDAAKAANARTQRADEDAAAFNAAAQIADDDERVLADGEDVTVDSEDDNESLWDELAEEMLDDIEAEEADAPDNAHASAVEERNRSRVESVMNKFAQKQASASGKHKGPKAEPKSRKTGAGGGSGTGAGKNRGSDDDDSDILDEIDLLTDGYDMGSTQPRGFALNPKPLTLNP